MGFKIAANTLRGIFLINLILGILFWTGTESGGLTLVHMLLGIIFVGVLWYIGTIFALRGGNLGLQIGVFVLGLAIALLGLFQRSMLPGGAHWVIQVLHLLLAVLGIGLAEMIGARMRRAGTASVAK